MDSDDAFERAVTLWQRADAIVYAPAFGFTTDSLRFHGSSAQRILDACGVPPWERLVVQRRRGL